MHAGSRPAGLPALRVFWFIAARTSDAHALDVPCHAAGGGPVNAPEQPGPAAAAEPAVCPASRDRTRIGYVDDHRFVATDGTRSRLPVRGRIRTIARLGDGFLVTTDRFFEGYGAVWHVRGGRIVEKWSSPAAAVVGRDGTVAWGEATPDEVSVRPPPAIRLEHGGVRLEQRLMSHPVVAGIVGRTVIYTAMFATTNGTSTVRLTDLTSPPVDLPLKDVVDVDEVNQRILGQVGTVPPAVMELDGLRRLWNPVGRRHLLLLFSPDGARILAEAGGRRAAFVDAETGRVSARFVLPRGTTVYQYMWETNRSLLMVVTDGGEAAIARATLDGRLGVAVGPVPYRGGTPPYALEQRP